MSLTEIEQFLFWCTVINVGLLAFSSILVISLRNFITRFHGPLFGLTGEQVSVVLYAYLGIYKIFVITFNLVPWIACKLLTP